VGWSSEVAGSIDRFQDQVGKSKRELVSSLGAEKEEADAVSLGDLLSGHGITIDFQVEVRKGAGVEDITRVIIRAVYNGNSRYARLDWGVGALSMRTVLADLGVGSINGDDLIVSFAVSNNGVFLKGQTGSLTSMDLVQIELQSVGKTSLNVLRPFGSITTQGNGCNNSMVKSDDERLGQGIELFVGLETDLGLGVVCEFPIVGPEEEISKLDSELIPLSNKVNLTRHIEHGGVANVIFRTGLDGGAIFVHVLLSRLEQAGGSGSLYHP